MKLKSLLIGAALIATTLSAHASTVAPGWWNGSWQCTIDGRPAQMKWSVVDVGGTTCDGDVCTSTSEVAWRGRFSDNGSPWVQLTNARPGRSGGLYFNHADGNKWYLPRPTANRTNGWTTWNGNRYPLSCWR